MTTTDEARDEVSRLRLALLRLGRRLRQQNPSGITPSQLSALSTIDHHGPLTIGELAALENVQPPSISRVVGTLEGEGYVERTADAADRRVALVATTTKARRELARIRGERNAWLARRLDVLDAEERGRLEAALPVLESLLDEEDGS